MDSSELRLSDEGPCAILIDAAGPHFDARLQGRILGLAENMTAVHGVSETVPGMNNCLVVYDPFAIAPDMLEEAIRLAWDRGHTVPATGIIHDIPVIYGGADGDLKELAATKAMSVDELVERHMAPVYSVAAVGAMPGFPYLSGLDPLLAIPRHANPRPKVPAGAVIIGGAQAGIMPITAPSGWHILGFTPTSLFDPGRARPALMRPGDQVRFVVTEVRR